MSEQKKKKKLPPRPQKPPPSAFRGVATTTTTPTTTTTSDGSGGGGGKIGGGGGRGSVFFGLAVGGTLLPPPPPPPPSSPGSPETVPRTPSPTLFHSAHATKTSPGKKATKSRGGWIMFEAPQYTTVKSDYAPPDAAGPAGSAAAAAAAAGGASTGGDGGRAVQLPLRTGEAMMVLGQTADKNWYLGASAGCRRYEGVFPSSVVHALIENPHFSTFGMSAQDMHVGADQNQNRNKHNSGSARHASTADPPASPHSSRRGGSGSSGIGVFDAAAVDELDDCRDSLGFSRSYHDRSAESSPVKKSSRGAGAFGIGGGGGGGSGSGGGGSSGGGGGDGGGGGGPSNDPYQAVLSKQRKEWSKLRATAEGAALLNDVRHERLWQRWRNHVSGDRPFASSDATSTGTTTTTSNGTFEAVLTSGNNSNSNYNYNNDNNNGSSSSSSSSKGSKSSAGKQVTAIIHVGVPPELRDQVWFLSSGAVTKQRQCPKAERYCELLRDAERRAARSQQVAARRLDRDQRRKERLQQAGAAAGGGTGGGGGAAAAAAGGASPSRVLEVAGSEAATATRDGNNDSEGNGVGDAVGDAVGDGGAEGVEDDEEWQAAVDIEKDLRRTFPTNSNFQSELGIAELRRVLLAYALRNPGLGYCQSMNFITAMLLLHMPEERAFWTLAAIVEDLLPAEYFQGRMWGMRSEQRVLQSCLLWKLPRTSQHLQTHGVDLDQVTVPWFMCLFVNSLPLDVLLRVWDCFFHEGVKALHRVALAIFKLKTKELLAMSDMAEIFIALRSPCAAVTSGADGGGTGTAAGGGGVDDQTSDGRGTGPFTADGVIRNAWATTGWLGSFPTEKIDSYRQQHACDLVQNNPMEHKKRATTSRSPLGPLGTLSGYSPTSRAAMGSLKALAKANPAKLIPKQLASSLFPSLPGRRQDSLATAIFMPGSAPDESQEDTRNGNDEGLATTAERPMSPAIHDERHGYSHY